jgi:hypothetical protein
MQWRVSLGKCLGLVVATMALSWCGDAAGAPMRRAVAKARARLMVDDGKLGYWDRYFLRALREQRLNVVGPDALRVLRPDAEGRLPQVPLVAYLKWRRALNPARFDRNHLVLGPRLAADDIVRSLTEEPIIPPPVVEVPEVVRPPSSGGEVPEPGSLVVALGMIGAGVAWGRILRRGGRGLSQKNTG